MVAFLFVSLLAAASVSGAVFNVRDFGASGRRAEDATAALQQAIEACAAAGGGTVFLPPGEYTSGTVFLRSRLRLELAAGATWFASTNPAAFNGAMPSKAALLFGEDVEDIVLTGGGTLHGQARYEWRDDDHERVFEHKRLMREAGKPIRRPFPEGFPARTVFPHLLWIGRGTNLHLHDLTFTDCPSWAITLYACERASFERLNVFSSLTEGVWADGIDLDGCRNVSIADCRIATGDDCIVFISTDVWGPALPCENISVRRCALSTASAGVKFSEGNVAGVRNVTVCDTVFTNSNRAFVLSTTRGGDIENVVFSDLEIHCRRFDWFWSGDSQPFFFQATRLSEFRKEPPVPGELPAGAMRHVTIRNVRARAQGSSLLQGHADHPIEGLRLENVRITLSADPSAPFDLAEHALVIRRVRQLTLTNVEVEWATPALPAWKSALALDQAAQVVVEDFRGEAAQSGLPAIVATNLAQVVFRQASAKTAPLFLSLHGTETQGVRIERSPGLTRAQVVLATNLPPEAMDFREHVHAP